MQTKSLQYSQGGIEHFIFYFYIKGPQRKFYLQKVMQMITHVNQV